MIEAKKTGVIISGPSRKMRRLSLDSFAVR